VIAPAGSHPSEFSIQTSLAGPARTLGFV